jgi:Mn2+/Fe2+ NRAMP family transporter
LIVRDICRRYVPGLKVAADSATLMESSRRDPVYKWSVALLGLSPLYIVFLSVEPIGLTLVVRSMVVIVIPVLVGSLMKIANDKALMGAHRPSLFSNAVMSLLVVVSVYLTIRDSGEWWRMLVR